jgi:hypothetical protein
MHPCLWCIESVSEATSSAWPAAHDRLCHRPKPADVQLTAWLPVVCALISFSIVLILPSTINCKFAESFETHQIGLTSAIDARARAIRKDAARVS